MRAANGARRSQSSGRAGRVNTVMKLGGHESGPEGPSPAFADLWFEIERKECLEEIAGQEGEQQEALDGVGVVLVNVVCMPACDQFVEPMILDIPPLVAEADDRLGGHRCRRQRGNPDPIADEYLVFTVQLPAHGARFLGADDPYRSIHLRPGKQAWKIPPQTLARAVGPFHRREGRE